jgi:hypothetical protein
MFSIKNREQEGKTGPFWVGTSGKGEDVGKGHGKASMGANIMYSCMKMEK